MIMLQGVSKHYQQNAKQISAVANVSLEVNPGEIFGLMGYSGAGKSTLLRLMNLLERPDIGDVIVNGKNLTKLSAAELRHARQKIGMVFQHFNLMANLSVSENVALALKVTGAKKEDVSLRVAECLEIVELADRANHYPAQLSGGQKQRVGIARALAPNPAVILADEPTSALDPLISRSVLKCLSDINREFGVTIVIVTHELKVLERLCNRTALLDQGKLIETLTIENHVLLPQSALGKSLVAGAI